MTTEVLETSRGFTGSLAIGRESVLADIPDYRITERGYEEINISAEPN
jgi:hypothetical protein